MRRKRRRAKGNLPRPDCERASGDRLYHTQSFQMPFIPFCMMRACIRANNVCYPRRHKLHAVCVGFLVVTCGKTSKLHPSQAVYEKIKDAKLDFNLLFLWKSRVLVFLWFASFILILLVLGLHRVVFTTASVSVFYLWAAVLHAEVRIEITQGVDSARPLALSLLNGRGRALRQYPLIFNTFNYTYFSVRPVPTAAAASHRSGSSAYRMVCAGY